MLACNLMESFGQLQFLQWIHPLVDLSRADISVAEPQCHLADVSCSLEHDYGALTDSGYFFAFRGSSAGLK
jgi:hypothetical protein